MLGSVVITMGSRGIRCVARDIGFLGLVYPEARKALRV